MTVGSAVVVADTRDMPREEWLASRRSGIGGSDVSAILGLSSWSTPLQVWLDKTGLYTPEDAPSEAMEWGTLLEPVVADEFTRRSGVATEEFRHLLADPDDPHMLANVDRVIPYDRTRQVTDQGVYEGKCTSPWMAKEWADNRVPDHAALQTHHYLCVTGLPYAYVAVLIGGQRLEWRLIEADPEINAYLRREEREFWKLVENMEPPAPTEADAKSLGDVWTPEPGTAVVLDDRLLEALAVRERAKADEKAAKERAAVAQAQIELALGDCEFGTAGDGRVVCSWKRIEASERRASVVAAHRRFIVPKSKGAVA